jgi:hypothetical protein
MSESDMRKGCATECSNVATHQWTRLLPRVALSYRQHCPTCKEGKPL